MNTKPEDGLSRRRFIRAVGAGVLATAGAAALTSTAAADRASIDAAIAKAAGPGPYLSGKVDLKTPMIAENGRVVPIRISVDSPMTDADHVRTVHLFVQDNPSPEVAIFHFTPASGRAWVKVNCRMAQTSTIVALATMSDGSVHRADRTVEITLGGCNC